MNLILLDAADFVAADRVRLTDRRLTYVRSVHRAALGDQLRVGRLGGFCGRGTITRIDEGALEMHVVLETPPPPPAPATIVLALPRPKALRRMLQFLAAAGVKRIVLVNAWRVEKSYWHTPALAPATLHEQLLLGLEQAADTILPQIETRQRLKPFVEDEAPALIAGARALVAHPRASTPCPHAVAEPVTVAIGPEGGFIPYEVALFAAHGFEPVSLGPRPLRVEHALPALLGRIL